MQTHSLEEYEVSSFIEKKIVFIKEEFPVSMPKEGEITLYVNKGDRIKKGQPLFSINSETFLSEKAGAISFFHDSKNDLFKYSEKEYVGLRDIKNLTNRNFIKESDLVQADILLNIVNNHIFFIAFEISPEDMLKIQRGNTYKVFTDVDEFNISLDEFHEDKDGNFIGIFRSTDDSLSFLENRTVDAKIRTNYSKGIGIPKEALVTLDEKKGIFIVDLVGIARFREIKNVLDEDEDFLVISKSHFGQDVLFPLNINDEVIMNPKNIKHLDIVRH